MIRITRDPNPPVIGVFSRPTVRAANGNRTTRAAGELARAIAFFTDPANFSNNLRLCRKQFMFSVYRDADLVRALEAVFGKKCAYCESRFAHVTPKDIEHFRPKSEIHNGAQSLKPGYFWLACAWSNLLVSCPGCNRVQHHDVPGQAKKVRLGKGTQFPLSSEHRRVRVHTADVRTEEPARLLLDPCRDDPEQHLTFDDQGLVHPRRSRAGRRSRKGKVSIDVYALQRKTLVEERERVLKNIRFHFEQLRDLVRDISDLSDAGAPDAWITAKHDQIRRLRANLSEHMSKDAPYLAMIRDYLRRTRSAGGFDDLIRAGIDPVRLLPGGQPG